MGGDQAKEGLRKKSVFCVWGGDEQNEAPKETWLYIIKSYKATQID